MNLPSSEYRHHLADLLVAIHRCVYFLDSARGRISWPLSGDFLAEHSKDTELFMTLSAVNERFAKLQDTLAGAMRHAALLAGEPTDTFLRVLSHFEKVGVLPDLEAWQETRALRNLAAHEYGTDYGEIADHFNTVQTLIPGLIGTACRFQEYCRDELGIEPSSVEFTPEFTRIVSRIEHATDGDES